MSENSDIPCPDKVRLGQRVVEATQDIHRIRSERQGLEERVRGTDRETVMRAAHKRKREAEYALRSHVESHGC